MQSKSKVQGRIEIAVGLWLILSPWLLGFAEPFEIAAMTATAVGGVVFTVSLHDYFVSNAFDEWMDVSVGTLFVVSPVLFGYADITSALVNAVIAGLVIMGSALYALEQLRTFNEASNSQGGLMT